jgi:hypothetical protein
MVQGTLPYGRPRVGGPDGGHTCGGRDPLVSEAPTGWLSASDSTAGWILKPTKTKTAI